MSDIWVDIEHEFTERGLKVIGELKCNEERQFQFATPRVFSWEFYDESGEAINTEARASTQNVVTYTASESDPVVRSIEWETRGELEGAKSSDNEIVNEFLDELDAADEYCDEVITVVARVVHSEIDIEKEVRIKMPSSFLPYEL